MLKIFTIFLLTTLTISCAQKQLSSDPEEAIWIVSSILHNIATATEQEYKLEKVHSVTTEGDVYTYNVDVKDSENVMRNCNLTISNVNSGLESKFVCQVKESDYMPMNIDEARNKIINYLDAMPTNGKLHNINNAQKIRLLPPSTRVSADVTKGETIQTCLLKVLEDPRIVSSEFVCDKRMNHCAHGPACPIPADYYKSIDMMTKVLDEVSAGNQQNLTLNKINFAKEQSIADAETLVVINADVNYSKDEVKTCTAIMKSPSLVSTFECHPLNGPEFGMNHERAQNLTIDYLKTLSILRPHTLELDVVFSAKQKFVTGFVYEIRALVKQSNDEFATCNIIIVDGAHDYKSRGSCLPTSSEEVLKLRGQALH